MSHCKIIICSNTSQFGAIIDLLRFSFSISSFHRRLLNFYPTLARGKSYFHAKVFSHCRTNSVELGGQPPKHFTQTFTFATAHKEIIYIIFNSFGIHVITRNVRYFTFFSCGTNMYFGFTHYFLRILSYLNIFLFN